MVEETLTNREYRWTTMSYDELSKVVNDAYRKNPDIRGLPQKKWSTFIVRKGRIRDGE